MKQDNPVKVLFTENDGISWCPVRIIGALGAVEMMVKYYQVASPDHIGFGTGFAAVLAAIAAKNFTEVKT